MNDKPTRRAFFGTAGAALAAPLAATVAFAGEHGGAGFVAGRRSALEDLNAIRVLQQRFARLVGAGNRAAVARLFTDPAQAAIDETVCSVVIDGDDAIELASNGTAAARVSCIVTTAAPIEDCGTLVEMARLQGDGVVKRSGRRLLASSLVKRDSVWKFEHVELLA